MGASCLSGNEQLAQFPFSDTNNPNHMPPLLSPTSEEGRRKTSPLSTVSSEPLVTRCSLFLKASERREELI